jgi:hypothetical protein
VPLLAVQFAWALSGSATAAKTVNANSVAKAREVMVNPHALWLTQSCARVHSDALGLCGSEIVVTYRIARPLFGVPCQPLVLGSDLLQDRARLGVTLNV